MTVFQLKKIVFAISLCVPVLAHSAGLGAMFSSSRLGEPLSAEIELLSVSPSEINAIRAALASDQVYKEQSLEKPASSALIRIEVANNSKGQPVLKLSSSQPINEAFLDMLIEVEWPSGRLVKEYTLLLDPPGYQSNAVATPPVLPIAQSADNLSIALPDKKTAEKPAPVKPSLAAPASNDAANAGTNAVAASPAQANTTAPDEHTSVNGDTLYAIARQMKPSGVSVEQMVAALYQANQHAFEAENMHRLKAGKILRAPNSSQLDSMTQQEARILIAAHTAAWHAYKNVVASSVVHAPAQAENRVKTTQSGKIGAPAQPLPQASVSKDVLKLSAGDAKTAATKDAQSTTQDKLNATQEEETARNNQLKEQQSRAEALNKQLADIKKLMALKNEAMAKAQADAEQAKPAHEPVSPQTTANAEPAKQPSAQPDKAESVKQPASPAPASAEEKSSQNTVLTQALALLKSTKLPLPALAALPVLLGAWLWMRRRQKKQIDRFEQGIATADATQMAGNTRSATQPASNVETSFMTDFSQSPVAGVIDANDVDPIAEAEVYIAYGRDAQAEEILKDAISKDPNRQELKLKLLEMYHQSESVAAFNALAGELYAQSPQDAVWAKVAAMGQKMDAGNPLYRQSEDRAQAPVIPQAAARADAIPTSPEAPALMFEMDNAVARQAEAQQQTSADTLTPSVAESSMSASTTEASPLASDLKDVGSTLSEAATGEGGLNLIAAETAEKSLPEADDVPAKALDLPTLDFEQTEASPTMTLVQSDTGAASLSPNDAVFEKLPDLSFELGADAAAALEPDVAATAVSLQSPSFEAADLNLDLPDPLANTIKPSASPVIGDGLENLETLPDLNLDAVPAASSQSSAAESEEVDTKLDLIKAYIDMEDMVGAKELIEEVLEEGGPNQRQQAQALLKQIA